jgi:RimJ/RimL family protein N-acetyltransferase
LERATAADIPFVMATERTEGYETLVGRWEEARHRAALADPRYAYFVGYDGTVPVGFVIVRDWASLERVSLIKRSAVARAGAGHGRNLLAAVVDATFGQTDAHRLWLGVYPENARARKVYKALGFREEGISRGSAFFGGEYRDELVMAILRNEWLRQ